jgi:hypothetical protein
MEEALIDLPDTDHKGAWTGKYRDRIDQAEMTLKNCDRIAERISAARNLAVRNDYTLEIYEQVNEMARFNAKALLTLKMFDEALNGQQEAEAMEKIRQLPGEFDALRKQLEEVYGKTRLVNKPEGYKLDQDHHYHLANQAVSFDWQFNAEILFMRKIQREY